METENNQATNQPDQKPAEQPVPMAHEKRAAFTPVAESGAIRRPRRKLLIAMSTLVVLVAIALGWSWWLFGRNTTFNENANIDTGGFQAVFLTNGQVYFGKLSDLNHKYVTITDIYYLQVQQSQNKGLQGSSSSGDDNNSQVSLAKLGSELHGPKDRMYIASGQVLFWENLKSDSKVVQAIDKYQAQ